MVGQKRGCVVRPGQPGQWIRVGGWRVRCGRRGPAPSRLRRLRRRSCTGEGRRCSRSPTSFSTPTRPTSVNPVHGLSRSRTAGLNIPDSSPNSPFSPTRGGPPTSARSPPCETSSTGTTGGVLDSPNVSPVNQPPSDSKGRVLSEHGPGVIRSSAQPDHFPVLVMKALVAVPVARSSTVNRSLIWSHLANTGNTVEACSR